MRKTIFPILIILYLACFATLASGAPPKPDEMKFIKEPALKAKIKVPPYYYFRLPDLTVTVEGPVNVAAGDDIVLTVTVENKGTVEAPGSKDYDYWKSYYVDLILSKDANFPIELATQPVYAGATINDFVEDMLLAGGRISVTWSLAAKASHVYTCGVHIPEFVEPGFYYLAAVVDPRPCVAEINEANNTGSYLINIAPPRPEGITPPSGVDMWVMPYAVGNTPINTIKPTGLIDYRDGLSTYIMTDAPFGRRLGFRLGYNHHIPLPAIYYYRWLYRLDGETEWDDFSEPVGVHYVREDGMFVSFPILWLGPNDVDGKNLYRFKPHNPPNEMPIVTYWPTSDWFGDIYAGFLNTHTLPDGKYTIKLEIYSKTGVQVMPTGSNRFIVPDGTMPDGTILSRIATSSEIDNGGFIFPLYVNNQPCSAYVAGPAIGGNTASDECGFLIYAPDDTHVSVAFDAVHPDGFAMFRFFMKRGIQTPVNVHGEVWSTWVDPFTGDGAGSFGNNFTIAELLSPACPLQAAFSENLHVFAKATTGWNQRISHYDAYFVRAFALSPY